MVLIGSLFRNTNLLLSTFLTICLIVCYCFHIEAQSVGTNRNLILNNQVSISFAPVLYNRIDLDHNFEELVKSRNTISGVLSISYRRTIFKEWGGNIGAEITVVPFSIYSPYEIGFDFSSNTAYIKEASFGLDLNEYIYDNFMYGYFISLDKIIYKKKRQMASVEAGLKLNRLVAFPYEEQFGIGFQKEISSYYEVFSTYFDNYFQRNFISYFVKVNWIKVAPSKQILVDGKLVKEKKGGNTFSLFSIINYCPQKIGKGYYKFSYFEFENSGQVELGINYFGIGISYGFAF